jgi:hypothetical protein
MDKREPSAAEALYGHLRAQVPELPAKQRPSSVSVADAMWPSLTKPPPPDDSFLLHMKAMGLVRIDERRR